MYNSTNLLRRALLPVCLACAVPAAHADLLVYEGFDYGTSDIALNTLTPSASTGLNGQYTDLFQNGMRYQPTGETLGTLPVIGGRATIYNYTNVVATGVAASTPSVTGDLFISYVARATGTITGANGLHLGINTALTGASANRYFNVQAISGFNGTSNIAISYDVNPLSSSSSTVSSQTLTAGTDYLLVAHFTNVGTALSVENPGVATLWVLTAAQYDYFSASGFSTTAFNSATVGSGASEVYARVADTVTSGTYSFSGSSYLQLTATSTGGVSSYVDEIRIGTSLNDVVAAIPIPEPSSRGRY